MVNASTSSSQSSADSSTYAHPLDPLSISEIQQTVEAVRRFIAKGATAPKPIQNALFNSIDLREPYKYAVLSWSGLFKREEIIDAGGDPDTPLTRQAELHMIDPKSAQSFEAIVDLPSNLPGIHTIDVAVVTDWKLLDEELQPSLQPEELLWAEEICQNDAKVKEACDAIGVDQKLIAIDGWCIGHDERYPGVRLQQCFPFLRLRPGDNLYAHPLDFVPVIDSHTGEVLCVDYPPKNPNPGEAYPPTSAADYEASVKRNRFAPPMAAHNYLPEQIVQDEPDFKLRETLKPLHVIQPEGVSYKLEGRTIKWEGWSAHIGFSYRDGLILSGITYDDPKKGTRPLFYSLSVAEMVVPYAKTIFPAARKSAFDTGEYGIGALANSLELGCDCLGSITYLDAHFSTRAGGIETIKSAICIHEEDAGILHKHTDFRDMKAHVARNRKLVISSICTVANYEYGFYFNFALDGSIELEVKATGIVNAYCLDQGEPVETSHEVEVAPRIAAQHHQHLFSYRIDSMVDGLKNSVAQVDCVPDEGEVGSATNYYGNGFHTEKTIYKTAKEAVSHYDAAKSRAWVIQNPNKTNYVGNPVGYKIMSKDMPPLLGKPGSLVWNRAPFARANMFVTPWAEDQLYPSDIHINQHKGGELFGLAKWVAEDGNIENADVVCWPCFGVSHTSRAEDWPIMPVEILRVHLKPANFFDRNPGLDVPSKADIKSRNANEAFKNLTLNGDKLNTANGVHANGANGSNGSSGSCCGSK